MMSSQDQEEVRAAAGELSIELELLRIGASTKRREEEEAAAAATVNPRDPPPPLPVDVMLDIVARSDDAATVVRCAAAWKSLRAAILDPAFRNLLDLRAAANGGFDPNLLMAVSSRFSVFGTRIDPVTFPPSSRYSLDAALLQSSEPESYRDGLLVLRQNDNPWVLRVCNTITGDVTSLPRMKKVLGVGFNMQYTYRPALLSVHGAGRSFELLVMYVTFSIFHGARLETQTFSSENAKWSNPRLIHLQHPGFGFHETEEATAPAVVGRTVHWLCRTTTTPSYLIVLALDDDSVEATVINLPPELLASMMAPSCGFDIWSSYEKNLILAATAEGTKLSVVVAEKTAISTWTLLQEQDGEGPGGGVSWSRQAVVRRGDIGRQLRSVPGAYQPFRFIVFGETSGTLLFWISGVGLLQLNLGTKKVRALWLGGGGDFNNSTQAILHEINLVSLLQCMKHF